MKAKVGRENKYLFGPVPSRRLGLSLGVDVVPFKVCSLDCVYCQLGRTTEKSVGRREYVLPAPILAELADRLAKGLEADFITISGSGEPTLNCRLGDIVAGIKKLTDIRVAILTNGTLFYRPDVCADCAGADVVLPSLDAGDEQTFQKINRPNGDISIEKHIAGLCQFRREYSGQIWLEVFVAEGFNTAPEQIGSIRAAIERIRPDKVQLNTAVRPTADAGIARIEQGRLAAIAAQLGAGCEIIADFSAGKKDTDIRVKAEDVLSILKRRPCSLADISGALGIHRNEALKYISRLLKRGLINSEQKDGTTFFKA